MCSSMWNESEETKSLTPLIIELFWKKLHFRLVFIIAFPNYLNEWYVIYIWYARKIVLSHDSIMFNCILIIHYKKLLFFLLEKIIFSPYSTWPKSHFE
jgi:hypothetical protein